MAWRARQPGVVVFTNGVFDLLHPGHVHLLESARKLGDGLIVGINDDASGMRLPMHWRLRMLSSISATLSQLPCLGV